MLPTIKRIESYNSSLTDTMRPLKWQALKENPFRFYRGTCHLFVEDYKKQYGFKSKIRSWVCGDLHFENFGSYKGENRLVYFDINDFDEAALATPEYELARFLTSIIIAGRQMQVPDKQIYKAILAISDTYCNTLSIGKALMMEQEVAHKILKNYFEQLQHRDREKFVASHTQKVKGSLEIKIDDTRFLPIAVERKKEINVALKYLLKNNNRFSDLSIEDTAFRRSGTGSLGLERYAVLCFDSKKGKHYFIDIKEARQSSCSLMSKIKQPKFNNEAERVIYANWVMQFCPQDFLAAMQIKKDWFIVKELQPQIDKMTLESFDNNFSTLTEAALEMVPLMAYAQLRSAGYKDTSTPDQLMLFAKKKQWQQDIIDVCGKLANKNDKYYKEFTHIEIPQ